MLTVHSLLKAPICCILLLSLVCNSGCKSDNKDFALLIELDAQKTKELLAQVIEDEHRDLSTTMCITERPKAIINPEFGEWYKLINTYLEINDSAHYKLQSSLYRQFTVSSDLLPNQNIITEKQFEEYQLQSDESGTSFWDLLKPECGHEYYSVTKPIFNETFDLAFVQIGSFCGDLCGGGREVIYTLVDGKWIEHKVIGKWVS